MSILSFLFGIVTGIVLTIVIMAAAMRLAIGHFRRHPEMLGKQVLRPIMKAQGAKLKKVS